MKVLVTRNTQREGTLRTLEYRLLFLTILTICHRMNEVTLQNRLFRLFGRMNVQVNAANQPSTESGRVGTQKLAFID